MSEFNENELIPRYRFPEFENGNWKEKKLGDICDINPKVSQLPDVFVYIDLESVEKGMLLQKKIINLEEAPSRAQRLLKDKDVVFQTVRPYQKNNYYFRKNDNYDYVASTGYAQLRAYESSMFLFQLIHTDCFVSKVLEKCSGSNYPAINSSDLSQISVELPSNTQEQQKIASCLTSLDEIISAEKQKLDTLKDHKKGLLQNLFPAEGETVPKLRFREFEDCKEWEEKALGEIGEIITGSTPPTNDVTNYNGNKLFVSPADISGTRYVVKTKTTLSDKGFNLTRHIKENSVLFVCIGSTIGKVAQNKYECATNQQINSLVTYKGFSSDFLYSLLDNNSTNIASIAGNHAVPIINKTSFSVIKLPFPPNLAEQQKIASCLSSIDELINAQSQKIEALKLHKKGLLQGLFPDVNG